MSKFSTLEHTVAAGYVKKGVSAAKAKQIGAAVAAKQGIKKLGKKKFFARAKAGKTKSLAALQQRAKDKAYAQNAILAKKKRMMIG